MGINIPERRELYGRSCFEDNISDESNVTMDCDVLVAKRLPHMVTASAVRITAENAEAGFKPTRGGIQELNFVPSQGYGSTLVWIVLVLSTESQFGHLFVNRKDREDARRNMVVLALKELQELSIRSDSISTTVDNISKFIEFDDVVNNKTNTGWLDVLTKENIKGLGQSLKEDCVLLQVLPTRWKK